MRTQRLQAEGWTKRLHAKGDKRQLAQPQVTLDTAGSETRNTAADKEGHHIRQRVSSTRDVTSVSIYTPNIGTLKYLRQPLTDLNGNFDSNTIIAGDYPIYING